MVFIFLQENLEPKCQSLCKTRKCVLVVARFFSFKQTAV